MTTQAWARQRARELMQQHGVTPDWRVGFDRARSRAGQTNYTDRMITLSMHFVAANTPERVEQTILHEIAHVLAGHQAGHGPRWRAIAQRLGHSGKGQYNAAETVMPEPAWAGSCGCGHGVWKRHRLTARMRTARCAGCSGAIIWRHRS